MLRLLDKRSIYYVRYPNLAIYYCLTMASGHYLPILYHSGWGKTAAIREDEEKSLWAAITSGVKGSARLKRRKIGGERKLGHGPGKVWWIWVKNVCWCAETSPKIQGGTEWLTIDKRRVPELEVCQNCNTEPTTGRWLLLPCSLTMNSVTVPFRSIQQ